MQLNPLLQPCRYFDTPGSFLLRSAMDDDMSARSNGRCATSAHPQIERVVKKQIGQQGADDSSLWSASFTLQQTSLFILRRRFQPALDGQFHPPLLRVFPNGPHHQRDRVVVKP
jgi:hypothetical protein